MKGLALLFVFSKTTIFLPGGFDKTKDEIRWKCSTVRIALIKDNTASNIIIVVAIVKFFILYTQNKENLLLSTLRVVSGEWLKVLVLTIWPIFIYSFTNFQFLLVFYRTNKAKSLQMRKIFCLLETISPTRPEYQFQIRLFSWSYSSQGKKTD